IMRNPAKPIDVLIAQSSFGELDVARLRQRTPWRVTKSILRRSEKLGRMRGRAGTATYEHTRSAVRHSTRPGRHSNPTTSTKVTQWHNHPTPKIPSTMTTIDPSIPIILNILLTRPSGLLVHPSRPSRLPGGELGDDMKSWWEQWPGRLEAE